MTMFNITVHDSHYTISIMTEDIFTEIKTTELYKSERLLEWLSKTYGEKALTIFDCFEPPSNDVASMARKLPGVHLKVKHPNIDTEYDLYSLIMNLNDNTQPDKGRPWTREEIADWIEAKFDIDDISFNPSEDKVEEESFVATELLTLERVLSEETGPGI